MGRIGLHRVRDGFWGARMGPARLMSRKGQLSVRLFKKLRVEGRTLPSTLNRKTQTLSTTP